MSDITIRTGRKISWDPVKGEVTGDPEANKLFIREMRSPYSVLQLALSSCPAIMELPC